MAQTHVDTDRRERLVRELIDNDTVAVEPDGRPLVVRSTLVFERDRERRTPDEAPLRWHHHADGLAQQFARARRVQYA